MLAILSAGSRSTAGRHAEPTTGPARRPPSSPRRGRASDGGAAVPRGRRSPRCRPCRSHSRGAPRPAGSDRRAGARVASAPGCGGGAPDARTAAPRPGRRAPVAGAGAPSGRRAVHDSLRLLRGRRRRAGRPHGGGTLPTVPARPVRPATPSRPSSRRYRERHRHRRPGRAGHDAAAGGALPAAAGAARAASPRAGRAATVTAVGRRSTRPSTRPARPSAGSSPASAAARPRRPPGAFARGGA